MQDLKQKVLELKKQLFFNRINEKKDLNSSFSITLF